MADFLALVITIATVELSIWLNGVRDVDETDSSGQLTPLVIGVGSFTAALTHIIRKPTFPSLIGMRTESSKNTAWGGLVQFPDFQHHWEAE